MKRVIITISENYLGNLQTVTEMLKREGLHIRRVYDFGIIAGEIEETRIAAIRGHKEVAACEEDREANIPPPDADIQ